MSQEPKSEEIRHVPPFFDEATPFEDKGEAAIEANKLAPEDKLRGDILLEHNQSQPIERPAPPVHYDTLLEALKANVEEEKEIAKQKANKSEAQGSPDDNRPIF